MSPPLAGEAGGTLVVRDLRVAWLTAGVARLLGRPAAEVVGRSLLDLVVPEDRARLRDRYERRLAGEPIPVDLETTLLRADGTTVPVEAHVTFDGEELVLQLRDVTVQVARRPRLAALAELGVAIQRERAEAEVLARVRAGLAGAGLWSLLVRAEGTTVRLDWAELPERARAAFQARLGRGMEGFAGAWSPFSRRVWSEGAAFTDDWGASAGAFVPPDLAEETRRFATAAGLSRAVGVRLDEREAPRAYLVLLGDWLRPEDVAAARLFGSQVAAALDAARVISDLSRRNADLAALSRLGELAGDTADVATFIPAALRIVQEVVGCDAVAVWMLDEASGELVLAHGVGGSSARRRAYERLPAEDPLVRSLAGRAPFAAEAGEPGPYAAQVAASGLASGAWVPLFSRTRPVGALAAAFARPGQAQPRLDVLAAAGAHVAGALATHRLLEDLRRRVGELTRLNDELSAAHRDLERAQERLLQRERLAALGELAAVVAHEVRNPLGVIFNSVGSLRRLLKPGGDTKLLLDIVGEEAERLNRIVGDLLDFARPSTPQLRPAPLARVVDEAVASAVGSVPGITVRGEYDPALPPVPIDERMVRQAVVNLAANAAQAMPRGGALDVRVRREGAAAVVELEDEGPGIPDELVGRIFEPFFTTRASGTGLGLAVVKRIVEGHGAEISVRPGQGGGTVFAVRFPLATEVESAGALDFRSRP